MYHVILLFLRKGINHFPCQEPTKQLLGRKLLLGICFAFLALLGKAQNYSAVAVSGYNADVIADGAVFASSVTADVDNAGYYFLNQSFTAFGTPTYYLPTNGLINSITTTGLSFQLADATLNNSLRLVTQAASGTLTFNTTKKAGTVYLLVTSGSGISTADVTINFSDATTQVFSNQSVADWYGGTPVAIQGIGRTNNTALDNGGTSSNPRLYQMPLALSGTNYSKDITSVTITKTSSTGALQVMGVSINASCTAPAAQPTALLLSPASTIQINGSFTATTADQYLVVRYPSGGTPVAPVNGTTYTAGAALGTGTVVQLSASTTFSTTGLTGSTTYSFYVYAANLTNCAGPVYNSASPLTGSQATSSCAGPSGTIAVGPTGTYTTLTAAMAATASGIGGPVTFELQSTYTSTSEAFPITISNSGCLNSTNTVTIRPAAGANGLVINGSNAGPTIDFNGSSYVTIDGRPGGIGSSIAVTAAGANNATNLNIINTNIAGAAIRLDNQSFNNRIVYCDLQGQNNTGANVPSTLSGVVYFGSTGTNGNDNNLIDHCNIHSSGTGANLPSMGVYSLGATNSGLNTNFNDKDTVSSCNIYDYFLASGNSVGLELNQGADSWTIKNNSFFQTATCTFTAAGYNRAIWIISNRTNGTSVGNGFVVTGNYVGGSAPGATGTAYTLTAQANVFDGIRLEIADGTTANPSSVQGNTITNISITSTATADPFHGIAVTSANGSVNVGTVTGNTIGSATVNSSITIAAGSGAHSIGLFISSGSTTAATAIFNVSNNIIGGMELTSAGSNFSGIFDNSYGTLNINNNTIGGSATNSIYVSSTSTTASFVKGINISSGTLVVNIAGNTISNLSNASLATGSTVCQVVGVAISGTSSSSTIQCPIITGNTIKNLYNASAVTGTGASASVLGISMNSTYALAFNVSSNTIDSLVAAGNAAVVVTGLYFNGSGTVPHTIYKNFIHSLDASGSTTGTGVVTGILMNAGTTTVANNMVRLGIKADGTDIASALSLNGIWAATTFANNFYHNSVYIGGTGVGTTATNTFAFRRTATSGTYDIRNNVFVNNRSNATTGGKHYTTYFTTSSTGATANYNVYQYTGTGGTFAYSGTADVAAYTTGWITTDLNSLVGNPQFINPTGTATLVNLHIAPSGATWVEGTGTPIAAITDDYDGQARSGLTPVDIGADAGNFISFPACAAPTAPTALVLTPASAQINGSFTASSGGASGYVIVRYLTGATITGPTDGASYTVGASLGAGIVVAVGTPVTFSSTGLLASTSYTYYVYAYTNTSCIGGPKYSTGLSGIQSTTACSGPSGTLTVGPSGTYTTLTSALTGISSGFSGAVVLELQSNYVSTAETFPITLNSSACLTAVNTLTIRPATGANGLVINGSNAGPTVDFNGSSYVTIDGRPGGIGSTIAVTAAGSTNSINLNIINTNAAGAAIRMDNGASRNSVRYCDLQGQNTTAANVPTTLSGVVYFGNNGAAGNDYNTIDHCNVHSSGSGTTTPSIGIYSLGYDNQSSTAAYVAQFNDNDTVSNNNIYDYYSTANSVGIEANYGNTGWNITSNSFFQTSAITVSSSATSYNRAIWLIPYRGSFVGEVGNGFTVTGNYIGGSLPGCGGTPYTFSSGTTGYFEAVRLELADAATAQAATSVQGNTITNISITSSTSSDAMHGITVTSGNGNVNVGTVTGNTIGSATGTSGAASGGITITATGGVPNHMVILGGTYNVAVKNNIIGNILLTEAGSYFSGIFTNASIVGNLSNNTITNITASNTGTTSGRYINGIQVGSGSPTLTIANNTISGLSCNYLYSGTTVSQVVGINIASTTATMSGGITGNTVKNLYNASLSTATLGSSAIIGICAASTNATGCNVSQNTIDSLVSTATSGAVNVIGLYYSGTTSVTNTVSRNSIHSLTAANTAAVVTGIYANAGTSSFTNNMVRLGINPDGTDLTMALSLSGINIASASANNFYHNSIYIGGTLVSATASTPTFAFRRTVAATHDIRNNIFSNVRSNATIGGTHYAIALNSTASAPTCNYNVYQYTGTGGSFASADGGTTAIATYAAATPWTSGDANSKVGNPQFINPIGTVATGNLHISLTVASAASNAGTPIASVTTDFDGDGRSATIPDIGADEFSSTVPVTLLEFKGIGQQVKNLLLWSTATENNSKGFELQRSIDGIAFSALSFINSKAVDGNSNAVLDYEFTDSKPLAFNNYYRLKQVDKDGHTNYSSIVLLKGNRTSNAGIVALYPNPVTDILHVLVTGKEGTGITLMIHDAAGKAVATQSLQVSSGGSNTVRFNVSGLSKGVYVLKMVAADGSTAAVGRFLK